MIDELAIREREPLGIATVMLRKGASVDAVGAVLGLPLVDGPAAVSTGPLAALGTGPGMWLVQSEDAAHDFAERLAGQLRGLASVSDQSSGYAIFRLSGPGGRTILQRGAPIDFHPDRFGPGSVATTIIAHIGVIVRQVDDQPTYDLAVFRSLSTSFRHWLDVTAHTV